MKAGKHSTAWYVCWIVAGVICAAAIIALCIFNIPIPINKTVSALEVNMADESVCISREIQVSGYYYINLEDDKFEGNITISGYPETSEYGPTSFWIDEENSGETSLDYWDYENFGESYVFGNMATNFMLQDMLIGVFEHTSGHPGKGSYSWLDATIIVTEAEDRSEAMERIEAVWGRWLG